MVAGGGGGAAAAGAGRFGSKFWCKFTMVENAATIGQIARVDRWDWVLLCQLCNMKIDGACEIGWV